MTTGRYHFDLLSRHSSELALSTRRQCKTEIAAVKAGFDFLGQHFERLAGEPKSHVRNVRMALTARFMNHLFAQVLLAERGLILDAANSGRSATETIAFYWLVCADPNSAALYDAKESPRPVDIRKRLEKLNVDVAGLRDQYTFESAVAHVGNSYDNLQIKWDSDKDGKLLIGGGPNPPVQKAMLGSVPRAIALFVMHEPDYVVTFSDTKASAGLKS